MNVVLLSAGEVPDGVSYKWPSELLELETALHQVLAPQCYPAATSQWVTIDPSKSLSSRTVVLSAMSSQPTHHVHRFQGWSLLVKASLWDWYRKIKLRKFYDLLLSTYPLTLPYTKFRFSTSLASAVIDKNHFMVSNPNRLLTFRLFLNLLHRRLH